MNKDDILVCHTIPNKYVGFKVGGRYKVITHLKSKYDPEKDFIYVINDRDLSMRFDILDIPEYFLSISEWRDQQITKLI
jgi:hypothetical protein